MNKIKQQQQCKTYITLLLFIYYYNYTIEHINTKFITWAFYKHMHFNWNITCIKFYFRYTDPTTLAFLLQASALDPRFKSLPYLEDSKRLDVFNKLALQAIDVPNSQQIHVCAFISKKLDPGIQIYNEICSS